MQYLPPYKLYIIFKKGTKLVTNKINIAYYKPKRLDPKHAVEI